MNSDNQILDVLQKINSSLDDIKRQMGVDSLTPILTSKEATPKVIEAKKDKDIDKKKDYQVVSAPSVSPVTESCSMNNFYCNFIEKFVNPVISASNELGGKYVVLGEIIDSLFAKMMKTILDMSLVCKKPETNDIAILFSPLKECNEKLNELNKDREFPPNYVKAMTEIISSVNWLNITEEPADMVTQNLDSATFWMNKIRREARDKMDKKPQDWCNLLIAMMKDLIRIITDTFPSGICWKENGLDIKSYSTSTPASAPASAPTFSNISNELAAAVAARRADDGSLCLKHVEKEEMVHKNSALRGNVKMEEKVSKVTMSKPPRCEKVQTKWMVEYQSDKVEVTTLLNETVYVLGCVGATIVVHDKCKSVIVDSCRKTNIIFDKCVSTVEVVNCKQCKIQCLQSVPTVAVDKTDGCTIFFPRSCIDTIKILSSKCSDMNVSFPSKTDDQDWIEKAIPEQYVHSIKDDCVETTVSDLYSS